jgi:hypothetical protein
MFGRDPYLPVDLTFGLGEAGDRQSLTKYVENLRTRLKESFELATAAANKARAKQKAAYDLKSRGADITVGNRVLVKKVAFDGKHKLADLYTLCRLKMVLEGNAHCIETSCFHLDTDWQTHRSNKDSRESRSAL